MAVFKSINVVQPSEEAAQKWAETIKREKEAQKQQQQEDADKQEQEHGGQER